MNVSPSQLPATLQHLKEEGYTRFVDLTAVDRPEQAERFELNYLLYHTHDHAWVRVKSNTAGSAPSVTSVFDGANACEREVYDMYGVEFQGHPMLRRLLMPDDWSGHPLRRDEPLGGEEIDFTTRRGPHGG